MVIGSRRCSCNPHRAALTICLVILGTFRLVTAAPNVASNDGLWRAAEASADPPGLKRVPWVQPRVYRAFTLDPVALDGHLKKAPLEFTPNAQQKIEITLPMPDGSFARFSMVESSVMEPALAAKFPEIKTYAGQGIDDPAASVRFDWTPAGFHAQVLSPSGAVYIDPQWKGDIRHYVSYYKRDFHAAKNWSCLTRSGEAAGAPAAIGAEAVALQATGNTLRTYRLACAATGEYTQFHGGTVSAGLAAIVTSVNRVSGVYEQDLAIRLVLVGNNNLIVYTNSGTDPYTNSNGSTMLGQNQSNLDTVIGSANYDIGHVFSTGGGGIAGLGVVCFGGNKARGVTGSPGPVGDPFDIDYVAHEMGHQFGANHTFNGVTSNCSGANRNASTAYEPGSGSTIMAYAGICGTDDLQPHSDPYFHFISLQEITNFITSGSCAVTTSTGNTAPTVSAGADFNIPHNTPFVLTAVGSDVDGDMLTFCWEQRDLGAAAQLTAADNGTIPLVRSFNPVLDPSRTFPRLPNLLSNTNSTSEKLPTVSRAMDFRVVARDNRAGGGGTNTDDMIVNVTTAAGPFRVTAPNTAVNWSGVQTVTWNVAGTTAAPVSTANVNILLSTDGGNTFPTMLASNTPNDGSQAVTLPSLSTSAARVKVQAAGNIYFDISDTNFSIVGPVQFNATGANAIVDTAGNGNGNGVIDPGENHILLDLQIRNDGSSTATNVLAMLSSLTPTVSIVSGNSSYPNLASGGIGTNNTDFAISVSPAHPCGSPIALQLSVSSNEGTNPINYTFQCGQSVGPVTFTYAGPAVAIVDNATVNISLPVSGIGTISDVNFKFNGTNCNTNANSSTVGLNHSFVGDLIITLISPANTQVILANRPGGAATGSGNNFCQTLFDDDGAFPSIQTIVSGNAPHTGTWLPANSLSAFDGQNANGNWTLRVQDAASTDTGNVRFFSLIFSTLQCTAPAGIPGDFDNDGDVDGDDFDQFLPCMTGANLGPATVGCQKGLLDGDSDIDQIDFGLFQRCISGSGVPGNSNCSS